MKERINELMPIDDIKDGQRVKAAMCTALLSVNDAFAIGTLC